MDSFLSVPQYGFEKLTHGSRAEAVFLVKSAIVTLMYARFAHDDTSSMSWKQIKVMFCSFSGQSHADIYSILFAHVLIMLIAMRSIYMVYIMCRYTVNTADLSIAFSC